jgi:hypothetical protein
MFEVEVDNNSGFSLLRMNTLLIVPSVSSVFFVINVPFMFLMVDENCAL